VKKGFLDSFEVLNLFSRVKPDEEMRQKKASEWILLLNQEFENKLDKPPVPLSQLLEEIKDAVVAESFQEETCD